MKNKLPLILGLTFIIYIFGFFILQIVTKDQTFSELENRNLATRPDFSVENLFAGTFTKDYETFVADQFPLRNQFISVKSNTERLLQKKENNGVYIGADHYFLQDFSKPDMDLANKNAGYISNLAEDFNVYVGLAPTATKVFEDKLPNFATPYDEGIFINDFYNELSDKVHKVPLLSTLQEHKNESIYYKTDHHWTTLGAYYGYVAFCETAGLTPLALDDFNIEIASNSFYGSLFSKGNFTFAKPDTLQLFYPKNEGPLTVTYEATGEVKDSLYAYDYLETKDKYSVFLDNNHPLIRIQTSLKNGKKIIVVKDSYANCFVPFLTAHYEEIQVVDLRLLSIPLKTFATQNNIDDVLILYNVQNFSTEGKLSLLTK